MPPLPTISSNIPTFPSLPTLPVEQQKQQIPLEEIEQLRAESQQNSFDIIRAAEERYAKAKHSGSAALQQAKDAGVCTAQQAAATAKEAAAAVGGGNKETGGTR
ncbi:hypothetical protein U6Y00_12240 [Cutibacterium acnes]